IKHVQLNGFSLDQIFKLVIVPKVIKGRNQILDTVPKRKIKLFIVLFVIKECFVSLIVKVDLYVLGITSLVNFSNKSIRPSILFVKVTFIGIIDLKKDA